MAGSLICLACLAGLHPAIGGQAMSRQSFALKHSSRKMPM
jgi:hypothetical protein